MVLLHVLIKQTFIYNVALDVFTVLVYKAIVTVGIYPWDVLKC